MRVWDTAAQKEFWTVSLLTDHPYSTTLAFTPDGTLAVADSLDTVHRWRVKPKP